MEIVGLLTIPERIFYGTQISMRQYVLCFDRSTPYGERPDAQVWIHVLDD
jgi:hypothetical protein